MMGSEIHSSAVLSSFANGTVSRLHFCAFGCMQVPGFYLSFYGNIPKKTNLRTKQTKQWAFNSGKR